MSRKKRNEQLMLISLKTLLTLSLGLYLVYESIETGQNIK